jgi:hypothetical protein
LNTKSKTLDIDSIKQVSPIVEMVDNWMNNRRLALVFETACDAGKLVYSSIDLSTEIENRPQAKQMLVSLLEYMNSEEFRPNSQLEFIKLQQFENIEMNDKKDKPTDIY